MNIINRQLTIDSIPFQVEEHCFGLYKAFNKELNLKIEAESMNELILNVRKEIK